MSDDPRPLRENAEHGLPPARDVLVENVADTTPTLEVPVAVTVSTPSTVTAAEMTQPTPVHGGGGGGGDYFTAHIVADNNQQRQQSHLVFSPKTPRFASSGTSDLTAAGEFEIPALDSHMLPPPERPIPQPSNPMRSAQSAESSATATLSDGSSLLQHSDIGRPFPNQSYAALHHQQHPVTHAPPRRQPTFSSGIYTFSSAVASSHQSGSRTAGNTPALGPTTGLFTTNSPPLSADWESAVTPGTYASPFLHFMQRVPPKETHVADIDVDPISGRKLINHYEVIDELGRGTHGKVKLGRDLHSDNAFVAIKIVQRFSKHRRLGKLGTTEDKVKKEVAILKKARHPHVVALLEVIDDPSRKKVYIVLEWVERGEIEWRAKAPKELAVLEARRYLRERCDEVDDGAMALDTAVVREAHRRLEKQRRRQIRAYRRVRREAIDGPEVWSNEMMGDDETDISDDDLMSRASNTTGDSWPTNPRSDEPTHGSLGPSPLARTPGEAPTTVYETSLHYNPSAAILLANTTSANGFATAHRDDATDLEGSMYGAYAPSSALPSRVPSMRSGSRGCLNTPAHHGNDRAVLKQMAADILDDEMMEELQYVPMMTLQQCRVAFRDTLLGLQYLHYQGIIHRDIKPPNLLATTDHRVKISDFGVSYLGRPIRDGEPGEDISEHEARDLDEEAKELAKTVGTPAFYAPELCIHESAEDTKPITKAIDVWALGITLFCMLFARTPFVDSEFIMMRQIAEEEVYIPRKRLRPVEGKSRSRQSSHNRQSPLHTTSGRRSEFDVSYEEIDDDLHDLLGKLLHKDPRKRITLEDVRKHPWTQADITNKAQWLEETDPSRHSEGKKIEITQQELNTAVVPLLDRVRSGIKKVGERLGFGGSTKVTGRGRTQSSAASTPGMGSPAPSSAASSSSNISHDAKAYGFHGVELGMAAEKAARDTHRLRSRHATSRSRMDHRNESVDAAVGRHDSSASNPERFDLEMPLPRPHPPERANTIMATGGSVRTLRQSDFRTGRYDETPPPSPGLPGTPTAVDAPPASSGLWGGGVARRILNTVRERSTARSSEGRAISTDRGSIASVDTHGEPSIAMSQTIATGHVRQPAIFDDLPPTSNPGSAYNSPYVSRPQSLVGSPSGDRLGPFSTEAMGALSRTSSGGSLTSGGVRRLALSPLPHARNSPAPSSRPQSRTAPESSAEEWERAEREYIRKRVAESRPSSACDIPHLAPTHAPEDPGSAQHIGQDNTRKLAVEAADPVEHEQELRLASNLSEQTPASSHEASPNHAQLPSAMMSSTSDFGSGVSASISNPSIPSVISEYEASSQDARHGRFVGPNGEYADEDDIDQLDLGGEAGDEQEKQALSSDDTFDPRFPSRPRHDTSHQRESEEMRASPGHEHSHVYGGHQPYHPVMYDHAASSDNGDENEEALYEADADNDPRSSASSDSEDSDGGLVMTRRRSGARSKRPSDGTSSRSPKLSRRSTASSVRPAGFQFATGDTTQQKQDLPPPVESD